MSNELFICLYSHVSCRVININTSWSCRSRPEFNWRKVWKPLKNVNLQCFHDLKKSKTSLNSKTFTSETRNLPIYLPNPWNHHLQKLCPETIQRIRNPRNLQNLWNLPKNSEPPMPPQLSKTPIVFTSKNFRNSSCAPGTSGTSRTSKTFRYRGNLWKLEDIDKPKTNPEPMACKPRKRASAGEERSQKRKKSLHPDGTSNQL